jgi:hypothetical protein
MTDLAPINMANAVAPPNGSTFRSGGQTKQYPPRPRIATARPQPAARPQPSERPRPTERSTPK